MRAMNETMKDVTMHSRMLVQRDASLHMSRRDELAFNSSSNLYHRSQHGRH